MQGRGWGGIFLFVVVPDAIAAAPGVVHLFVLQVLIHFVVIKAATDDVLLLNHFHVHHRLHICFLSHSCVLLSLLLNILLSVHDVKSLLRWLAYVTTLQVKAFFIYHFSFII